MKNPRLRAAAVVVLALSSVLLVAACGSSSSSSSSSSSAGESTEASGSSGSSGGESSGESEETVEVGFLPRAVNIPYFEAAGKGGEEAAEELGGGYKFVGPTEGTAPAQLPFITSLTQQGVGAIALAANDPNALVPSLKRAESRGVKVVTFDSDTAPEGREIFVNQATSESIGDAAMDILGKQLNGEGTYAMVASSPNSPNETEWIKYIEADNASKYPNLKLVKIAYGENEQKSYEAALGLLQAYPELNGIIGTNSFSLAEAAHAVESQGKSGKVIVTGLGTPEQMTQYVKSGTVPEFALWNPQDLGYLAYYAAAALIRGEVEGNEGESFEAGKLGERTIGANGEVILGPPTIFDAKNVEQFHF